MPLYRDEAALVARAKQFDRAAIAELYRRYVQRIYRYVYYRVGDESTAEDLTAEVFLRALEGLESYSYRGVPFVAWLYRIAQARVADYHRRWGRRGETLPLDEKLVGMDDDLATFAEHREAYEDLYTALQQLTEEQQQVIALKFLAGLKNAEVAYVLGKTEGAVKALQHRALASLQRILGEDE
ncbi:MAG: sigma-70 family RNA polymerase sigma factor [Anaerolineae bacterium]|nr:sigma-70 family RNA polymerase sigma factor [Anaerolineae bacterium]RLC55127.1 MAG: RNA polymerase subunit sigma-24 [Chloroflexota bacterium]